MTLPQASEGYVEAPGARLYYRDIGAGRPLVVLHGGPDFNHPLFAVSGKVYP
jgi:hypothetical protein